MWASTIFITQPLLEIRLCLFIEHQPFFYIKENIVGLVEMY